MLSVFSCHLVSQVSTKIANIWRTSLKAWPSISGLKNHSASRNDDRRLLEMGWWRRVPSTRLLQCPTPDWWYLCYIMVDDLEKPLGQGGRLSNGTDAGNLISIKPILYFNDEGVNWSLWKSDGKESHETLGRDCYQISQMVITKSLSSMPMSWKAEALRQLLIEGRSGRWYSFATFGGELGHLGDHSLAVGISPSFRGILCQLKVIILTKEEWDKQPTDGFRRSWARISRLDRSIYWWDRVAGVPVFNPEDVVGLEADVWVDFTRTKVREYSLCNERYFAPVVGQRLHLSNSGWQSFSREKDLGAWLLELCYWSCALDAIAAQAAISQMWKSSDCTMIRRKMRSGTAIKTELISEARENQQVQQKKGWYLGKEGRFEGMSIRFDCHSLSSSPRGDFGSQGEEATLRHDSYDRVSLHDGSKSGIKDLSSVMSLSMVGTLTMRSKKILLSFRRLYQQ